MLSNCFAQAQGEGGATGTSFRGPGGPYLFNFFYVGMAGLAVQRVHNYECGPDYCILVYFMVLMSLHRCGRGTQNLSCSGT